MNNLALSRRMMDNSLDWWRLSMQVAETWIASQTVVGARLGMIGAGLHDPARMPHAEMARFVPEKMAAFGKAQAGAARHLSPAMLTDAAFADGMAMVELSERMLAASLAWWRPVHARATANTRRLGRKH